MYLKYFADTNSYNCPIWSIFIFKYIDICTQFQCTLLCVDRCNNGKVVAVCVQNLFLYKSTSQFGRLSTWESTCSPPIWQALKCFCKHLSIFAEIKVKCIIIIYIYNYIDWHKLYSIRSSISVNSSYSG